MTRILFAARADRWAQYEAPLRAALDASGVRARLDCDLADPETVDFIVYAPNGPVTDFRPFTRLRAVLNLWAGVEDVVGNPTLTVPLARMVDSGLTEGMVEWCVGHCLRHHLGLDKQITTQDGVWRHFEWIPPLARDRRVCVLGLGALGGAVARALRALNFDVSGYSRSPKTIDGLRCFHGPDMLRALDGAEIVITLFPYTPETDGIVGADAMAAMAPGGVLINPGRGGLIDDAALLAALDRGQLSHATLDVFRTEPLPAGHPFWAHPQVTVTPHIASETRPESASRVIAENIRRSLAGEPLLHLVDFDKGY